MRKSLLVLLLVSLAALPALAQSSKNEVGRSIPGTFDPKTSLFTPTPAVMAPDPIAAAATIFGGKLVFNFTITVTSVLATTDTITCSASASVLDVASANFILESGVVKATRTGATATCTVTIPYSWSLTTASTDKMTLGYVINGGGSTAATLLPTRLSSQSLGSFAIPANGTTSTFTVKATI